MDTARGGDRVASISCIAFSCWKLFCHLEKFSGPRTYCPDDDERKSLTLSYLSTLVLFGGGGEKGIGGAHIPRFLAAVVYRCLVGILSVLIASNI